MKYQLLKLLFIVFLFIGQSTSAIEPLSMKRVDPNASEKADSLYNEAHRAYSHGNYEKAIKLYKESYEYKPSADAAINLGAAYDEVKDYDNAIKWYEKSYKMGDVGGAYSLGLLNENRLENTKNAIKWYKKGVKLKDYSSIKNLGNLYHRKNENIKGAAYMLGLLSIKPEKKEKLLSYLKTKWKLTDEELKKAYELQKTLIPNPYTGGID